MLVPPWRIIMTRTWRNLLDMPERRRGSERRQCLDRREDARFGEATLSRRHSDRRDAPCNLSVSG